jgi:hypothetical protein
LDAQLPGDVSHLREADTRVPPLSVARGPAWRLPGVLPRKLPGVLPGQLPGQLPGVLPGQLPGSARRGAGACAFGHSDRRCAAALILRRPRSAIEARVFQRGERP